MHCLLTALGSYGDVYPMIGLGVAMRDRGHDVTVVTNPHFGGDVTAAGLELATVAEAEDYDRLTRTPGLWSPTRGLDIVFREGALGILDELYKLIERLHRPGETVIAAHGLDLASRVAAETLGVPVASIVYAPMAMWSDESPPRMPAGFATPDSPRWLHRLQFKAGEWMFINRKVMPALEAFRAKHGLMPLRDGYWKWYYGVAPPIALFPDWFVDPSGRLPSDWPRGTVTTGFPLGDDAGGRGDTLDPAVEAFVDAGGDDPHQRPIIFTPGSAMRQGERFFAAAVGACQRLNRRGVLLTKYPEQLPRDLPDTILAPGFTPLAKLLARSAALVHHGGIGSSARGLAAGLPQLIQPMAFDQYDNAWRLRKLGVAEELKPSRFTAKNVAAKLQGLFESEASERAGRLATQIDRDDALARACSAIDRRLNP